jgi:hypothetical protein
LQLVAIKAKILYGIIATHAKSLVRSLSPMQHHKNDEKATDHECQKKMIDSSSLADVVVHV